MTSDANEDVWTIYMRLNHIASDSDGTPELRASSANLIIRARANHCWVSWNKGRCGKQHVVVIPYSSIFGLRGHVSQSCLFGLPNAYTFANEAASTRRLMKLSIRGTTWRNPYEA